MLLKNQVQVFKALADENRLLIVRALNERPLYVEILAERLSLSPSTVSFHLKKLEQAKIVKSYKDQYYKMFELDKLILNNNILKFILKNNSTSSLADKEEVREAQYEQKIIKSFIKYGKLKTIPVQRKKRLVILKHLCKQFELNISYPEEEVNSILGSFHEDFCTLRREMIAEKLMSRKKGVYIKV